LQAEAVVLRQAVHDPRGPVVLVEPEHLLDQRAALDAASLIGHQQVRVDAQVYAQAQAGRAGAARLVEREIVGLHLAHRHMMVGAGEVAEEGPPAPQPPLPWGGGRGGGDWALWSRLARERD